LSSGFSQKSAYWRAPLLRRRRQQISGFEVTAFQMFFFAGFAFAAALAFGLVARSYPLVDHYRKA
jgi:hypothetical protein